VSAQAQAFVLGLDHAPNGERLTPTERHVLLLLAYRHHPDYGCAWPKRDRLAEDSGLAEGSISRTLAGLRAKGVLHVTIGLVPVRDDDGRRERGNVYRFVGLDPLPTTTTRTPPPKKGNGARPYQRQGNGGSPYLARKGRPGLPDPGNGGADRAALTTGKGRPGLPPPSHTLPPRERHERQAAAARAPAYESGNGPPRDPPPVGADAPPPPPPPELARFDEVLAPLPGYQPNAAFFRKVLEDFVPVMDVEVQALAMADDVDQHPEKRARVKWILRWLERERRERPVPVGPVGPVRRPSRAPPHVPPSAPPPREPPRLPEVGPESDAARERVKAELAARGLLSRYAQIGGPGRRGATPP
jgi:hypothetical protein